MEVYEYTDDIDLSKLILYAPKSTQGGGYSAKIKLGNNDLVIQTPRIKTKNGIHKTEKKIYCDLLINKEKIDFINFIKTIEEHIKNKIVEKGKDWFKEAPKYKEINIRWNDIFKVYKNINTLVRTLVEKKSDGIDLKIWDEDQNELSFDSIKSENEIICLFHISNLRFSSTSFQIDLILKQIMTFKQIQKNKCLIKGINKVYSKISDELKPEDLEDSEVSSESDDSYDDSEYNEDTDYNSSNYDSNDDSQDESEEEDLNEEEKQLVDDINENFNKENTEDDKNSNNSLQDVEEKKTDIKEENTDVKDLKKEVQEDIHMDKIERLEKNKNLANLEEVNLEIIDESVGNNLHVLTLKKPKEVYLDIYRKALDKARKAKHEALKEYLNAKNIKKQYLLDEIETSDGEDLENIQ